MNITLVAAMAENRVIGRDNDLPWRLPADMRHFVALTRGRPIVMGRRNFESIGRPLPKRHNIILTRDPGYSAPGCTVVHDVDAALAAAGDAPEVMVIGGEAVYQAFLPIAHRIELTLVRAEIDGDVHFPPFEGPDWVLAAESHHPADADNPYPMDFLRYERAA
ncbi:dihydrofolate reductase [Spiribacter halobius]|uniref:Dihydrofolate reductase n=1 Tax=Sediminicurvatus halobius TaxID=2182432 RepID=A0A2U2N1L9_9GAMM|nr:dihydrofolate reductase [Spiribacter halobius]PWG62982.1 dihydrofolate reductase [Spiribacter halobius]UEX77498.1 dihydrofolate reductase [Spiribacter halobius]